MDDLAQFDRRRHRGCLGCLGAMLVAGCAGLFNGCGARCEDQDCHRWDHRAHHWWFERQRHDHFRAELAKDAPLPEPPADEVKP